MSCARWTSSAPHLAGPACPWRPGARERSRAAILGHLPVLPPSSPERVRGGAGSILCPEPAAVYRNCVLIQTLTVLGCLPRSVEAECSSIQFNAICMTMTVTCDSSDRPYMYARSGGRACARATPCSRRCIRRRSVSGPQAGGDRALSRCTV